MRTKEDFFTYSLVALTLLSCVSPVFAYACFAEALVVVADSLFSPKAYEPMINVTEVLDGMRGRGIATVTS